MPHVICEPCVGVKTGECTLVCPADAIYDAGSQYVINPEECIDCGACVDVCPVAAIYPADRVPGQWAKYIERNERLLLSYID
jgi:NAD-dependent dihydropyrimidine dehydrogenase PreA subunit